MNSTPAMAPGARSPEGTWAPPCVKTPRAGRAALRGLDPGRLSPREHRQLSGRLDAGRTRTRTARRIHHDEGERCTREAASLELSLDSRDRRESRRLGPMGRHHCRLVIVVAIPPGPVRLHDGIARRHRALVRCTRRAEALTATVAGRHGGTGEDSPLPPRRTPVSRVGCSHAGLRYPSSVLRPHLIAAHAWDWSSCVDTIRAGCDVHDGNEDPAGTYRKQVFLGRLSSCQQP